MSEFLIIHHSSLAQLGALRKCRILLTRDHLLTLISRWRAEAAGPCRHGSKRELFKDEVHRDSR